MKHASNRNDVVGLPLSLGAVFRVSGLAVLFLMAWLVIIGEIGFHFGLSPSWMTLSAATVLSAAGSLALCRRESAGTVAAGLAVSVAVVFASCAIAGMFHDLTVDGNAYHKLAVAAMQDGWNPLESSVSEWRHYAEIYCFETRAPLWVDHYAHGTWVIASAFYDVTGNIEQSKVCTLLAMYAVAALGQDVLKTLGLRRWQAVAIALIGAFNPITLVQFNTFYVDAFLMCTLMLLIAGLFLINADPDLGMRPVALAMVFASFVLCADTKFTGLAYAGAFSFAFCLLYLRRYFTKAPGFSRTETLLLAVFFVGTVVFSIVGPGWTSYVNNLLDHGHPLYPLAGEGAQDIMTAQQPDSFNGASTPEKLFWAYFSQCDQIAAGEDYGPQLKIPLTVSFSELESLNAVDLRMSGFGPLYSAVLIVSVIGYAALLVRAWRRKERIFGPVLAYGLMTLVLTFGITDSWWARYSGYVYISNLVVLGYWSAVANKGEGAGKGVSAAYCLALSALLAVNTLLYLPFSVLPRLTASLDVSAQVSQAAAEQEAGASVFVSYDFMPGQVYTLMDAGVDFTVESYVEHASQYDPANVIGAVRYRFE